jgi:hypothetical protein
MCFFRGEAGRLGLNRESLFVSLVSKVWTMGRSMFCGLVIGMVTQECMADMVGNDTIELLFPKLLVGFESIRIQSRPEAYI